MRKNRTMVFGATAAIAVVALGISAVPAAQAAAPASNTLTVTANQVIKPVTHVASWAI